MRISDWSSDVCSSDLSTSTTSHKGVPFHAYTGPRSGRMPRILTGVSGVCSAKPTERMKPGCTPVSHVTSGVGVPPGGTTGCAHAWHGIAHAMQVAPRAHGFIPAHPAAQGAPQNPLDRA